MRPPASPHRATPTALPAPNESHAGSRHHGPGAHLTTGPGLEQRRHTSGDALKGAGRVGRAAFTAALRRWHLVILAGDVYRGNVGRRTRWVRALPSHSYQCASRPRRRPAGRRASCHAAPAVAPGHAPFPRMAGHRAPDPDPRASGDVDQVRTKHHREPQQDVRAPGRVTHGCLALRSGDGGCRVAAARAAAWHASCRPAAGQLGQRRPGWGWQLPQASHSIGFPHAGAHARLRAGPKVTSRQDRYPNPPARSFPGR